jgi:hypothetical protein
MQERDERAEGGTVVWFCIHLITHVIGANDKMLPGALLSVVPASNCGWSNGERNFVYADQIQWGGVTPSHAWAARRQ